MYTMFNKMEQMKNAIMSLFDFSIFFKNAAIKSGIQPFRFAWFAEKYSLE